MICLKKTFFGIAICYYIYERSLAVLMVKVFKKTKRFRQSSIKNLYLYLCCDALTFLLKSNLKNTSAPNPTCDVTLTRDLAENSRDARDRDLNTSTARTGPINKLQSSRFLECEKLVYSSLIASLTTDYRFRS